MLETTIAGSLPKPAWLARPGMLWAPWQLAGEALAEAKRDATLLALKEQEDSGIDIVTDGEQSRQHFVHGFLAHIEGVDFGRQVTMGIRNNRYEAQVPTVTGALRRKGRVHAFEAGIARAHTKRQLKFTLPGPMTIVDTIADAHYRDKVALAMAFAALLNEEARELAAIGVDVIQFDEPAFNVYQQAVTDWGVAALHRAAGSPARPRSTSATVTASRRISTGRRASGPSGGITKRSFRPSRGAGSIRSRSSAPAERCRSSCSGCSPARMSCSA
jgi:5-methyltetrahydropteroyltriglutamate--homocysteine methyltransferase